MISAFKNIRLSGQSLIPATQDGTMRLTLNSSGLAYYGELTSVSGVLNQTIVDGLSGAAVNLSNASGVLQGEIDALSGSFNSFVSGLDQTYATDAQLSGVASGAAADLLATGQYIESNFIHNTSQQSFMVHIPQGIEMSGISFPLVFGGVPSIVNVTMETVDDIFYATSVKNKTASGFNAVFSDVVFEDSIYLNVFASM